MHHCSQETVVSFRGHCTPPGHIIRSFKKGSGIGLVILAFSALQFGLYLITPSGLWNGGHRIFPSSSGDDDGFYEQAQHHHQLMEHFLKTELRTLIVLTV